MVGNYFQYPVGELMMKETAYIKLGNTKTKERSKDQQKSYVTTEY